MKIKVASLIVGLVLFASMASAQSIGSAGSFGVLGATTVTNTGATVVTGNLGVSPGTAITGFLPDPPNTIEGPGTVTAGPGFVTETIYAGGLVAAQAHAAAFVANEQLKMMACLPANNLTGRNLGGLVLPPGTYCFDSSAQLTGVLTLTGEGPWVFKMGSTLTTATASAVLVPDVDVRTCSGAGVFWQVGSSATLGTQTEFVGNVVAETSITANAGVSVSGSLLAVNAAVTLDNNLISACGEVDPPPPCHCECEHKHKHHHHKGDHDGEHHHGKDDRHKDDCNDDHGDRGNNQGNNQGNNKGNNGGNGNGNGKKK